MNTTYYIVQVIKGGEVLFCSESKEKAKEFKKNHDYMHTRPTKLIEFINPDSTEFPKGLLIYAIVDYKVSADTGILTDDGINVKINLVKPCEHHEEEEMYVDTSSKQILKKKSDVELVYITHDVRCYIDSMIDESSFTMKDRAAKFIIDQILSLREKGLDKD